ncbi:MAG: CPBP family intramembrane glutamic endopeptidase [Candidatus Woesearchaeota archaeon]
MKRTLIILLVLPLLIIFISREFFPSTYVFSSLYKIIFLFPIAYRIFSGKKVKEAISKHFLIKTLRRNILHVTGIGLLLSGTYIGAFYVAKGMIPMEEIASRLHETISLDGTSIIFVGVYIIVLNSLLEEFFWRGFLFDEFRKSFPYWVSHLATGVGFSLHHVVFYYNWFSVPVFLVVTLGLIGYAIIMNMVFQRYGDLFSCWVIHAFADVAQIYIAFTVFGVI